MEFVQNYLGGLDVKMEGDKKDVGFIQDWIFGMQNLIAAEHHALESFATSKENYWIEIAEMIRKNRSKWMYKIIKESNDQRYCFAKHILASAMAMKELGNRFQSSGDKESAKECFDESATYESMFIFINDKEVKK